MSKKNKKPFDFLLLDMSNPEALASDYSDQGISGQNAQLLSPEEYKQSQTIQKAFTTEDGKFDEITFQEVYKNALTKYNQMVNPKDSRPQIYSYLDAAGSAQKAKGERVLVDYQNFSNFLTPILNTFEQSQGIVGVGKISERTKTVSEIAQHQNIWNENKQTFEDITPEDISFSYPFRDNLILATWDSDGTHIDMFGEEVEHVKGQNKLNEKGRPYYEWQQGKNLAGKEVLSAGNILTNEDSFLNNLDFLDSDGMNKSIIGSISKEAARIAPYFFDKSKAVFVMKDIVDLVPSMFGMFSGLFGADPSFNESLRGFTEKTTLGGVSEYSTKNMITFENMLHLGADVFIQLKGQNEIFNWANKIKAKKASKAAQDIYKKYADKIEEVTEEVLVFNSSAGKTLPTKVSYIKVDGQIYNMTKDTFLNALTRAKEAQKFEAIYSNLGEQLSKGYMAFMSAADTYWDAKSAGWSPRAAALMGLASTAMYRGILELPYADWIYPDKGLESIATRNVIAGVLKDSKLAIEGTQVLSTKATPSAVQKFFKKVSNKVGIARAEEKSLRGQFIKFLDKTNSVEAAMNSGSNMYKLGIGQIFSNSLKEATEETTEQLAQDMIYEAASGIADILSKDPDSRPRWAGSNLSSFRHENTFETYLMNALGGMVGGTIGGVSGVINYGKYHRGSLDANQNLVYALRNGQRDNIIKEIERIKEYTDGNMGGFGSNVLSLEIDEELSTPDNPVFKSVESSQSRKSQNEAVAESLLNQIKVLDDIMLNENIGHTDEEIIKNTLAREARFGQVYNLINTNSEIFTSLLRDYNSLTQDIINTRLQLKELNSQKTDLEKRNADKNDIENISAKEEILNSKLEKDREELKSWLEGDSKKVHYSGLALYSMMPKLRPEGIPVNVQEFAKFNYDVNWDDLDDYKRTLVQEDYKKFLANGGVEFLKAEFNAFKELNKFLSPILQEETKKAEFKELSDIQNNFIANIGESLNQSIEGLSLTNKNAKQWFSKAQSFEEIWYKLNMLAEDKTISQDDKHNVFLNVIKKYLEFTKDNISVPVGVYQFGKQLLTRIEESKENFTVPNFTSTMDDINVILTALKAGNFGTINLNQYDLEPLKNEIENKNLDERDKEVINDILELLSDPELYALFNNTSTIKIEGLKDLLSKETLDPSDITQLNQIQADLYGNYFIRYKQESDKEWQKIIYTYGITTEGKEKLQEKITEHISNLLTSIKEDENLKNALKENNEQNLSEIKKEILKYISEDNSEKQFQTIVGLFYKLTPKELIKLKKLLNFDDKLRSNIINFNNFFTGKNISNFEYALSEEAKEKLKQLKPLYDELYQKIHMGGLEEESDPAEEILKELVVRKGNYEQQIYSVIEDLSKQLYEVEDINKFLLDDSDDQLIINAIQQLEKIRSIIYASVKAEINGKESNLNDTFGYNQHINSIYDLINDSESKRLGTIDAESSYYLLDRINDYERMLLSIKSLHDFNKNNILNFVPKTRLAQAKAQVKALETYISRLINNEQDKNIKEQLDTEFKKLAESIEEVKNIDIEEDYENEEKVAKAIMTVRFQMNLLKNYYSKFVIKANKLDEDAIANSIYNTIIDEKNNVNSERAKIELTTGQSNSITPTIQELTAFDLSQLVLRAINTNIESAKNIYSTLEKDAKIYPISEQMDIIEQIQGFINSNNQIYSKFLKQVFDSVDRNEKDGVFDSLGSIMFVDSGAGAGKTSAIASSIVKLNDRNKIVVTGVVDSHTKNLSTQIGIDSQIGLDPIFEFYSKDEKLIKENKDKKMKEDPFKGKDIILIDEATYLTIDQLNAINAYSKNHKKKVIMFMDSHQPGSDWSVNLLPEYQVPILKAQRINPNLRTGSKIKRNNKLALEKIILDMEADLLKQPIKSREEYKQQNGNSKYRTTLTYSELTHQGDLITTEDEYLDYVKKFIEKHCEDDKSKKTFAIVYQQTNSEDSKIKEYNNQVKEFAEQAKTEVKKFMQDTKKGNPNNVTITTLQNVQGKEFDYVIAIPQFTFDFVEFPLRDNLVSAKNLNMLLTRGKQVTMLIDFDSSLIKSNIEDKEDNIFDIKQNIDKSSKEYFIKTKKILDSLNPEDIEFSTKEVKAKTSNTENEDEEILPDLTGNTPPEVEDANGKSVSKITEDVTKKEKDSKEEQKNKTTDASQKGSEDFISAFWQVHTSQMLLGYKQFDVTQMDANTIIKTIIDNINDSIKEGFVYDLVALYKLLGVDTTGLEKDLKELLNSNESLNSNEDKIRFINAINNKLINFNVNQNAVNFIDVKFKLVKLLRGVINQEIKSEDDLKDKLFNILGKDVTDVKFQISKEDALHSSTLEYWENQQNKSNTFRNSLDLVFTSEGITYNFSLAKFNYRDTELNYHGSLFTDEEGKILDEYKKDAKHAEDGIKALYESLFDISKEASKTPTELTLEELSSIFSQVPGLYSQNFRDKSNQISDNGSNEVSNMRQIVGTSKNKVVLTPKYFDNDDQRKKYEKALGVNQGGLSGRFLTVSYTYPKSMSDKYKNYTEKDFVKHFLEDENIGIIAYSYKKIDVKTYMNGIFEHIINNPDSEHAEPTMLRKEHIINMLSTLRSIITNNNTDDKTKNMARTILNKLFGFNDDATFFINNVSFYEKGEFNFDKFIDELKNNNANQKVTFNADSIRKLEQLRSKWIVEAFKSVANPTTDPELGLLKSIMDEITENLKSINEGEVFAIPLMSRKYSENMANAGWFVTNLEDSYLTLNAKPVSEVFVANVDKFLDVLENKNKKPPITDTNSSTSTITKNQMYGATKEGSSLLQFNGRQVNNVVFQLTKKPKSSPQGLREFKNLNYNEYIYFFKPKDSNLYSVERDIINSLTPDQQQDLLKKFYENVSNDKFIENPIITLFDGTKVEFSKINSDGEKKVPKLKKKKDQTTAVDFKEVKFNDEPLYIPIGFEDLKIKLNDDLNPFGINSEGNLWEFLAVNKELEFDEKGKIEGYEITGEGANKLTSEIINNFLSENKTKQC